MKRKANYFIIIYLLIFINSAFAQITFQKTFGGALDDYFYSVQQTKDGGYIMVGYSFSFGAGGCDVYLVKTDVNGDTLWTKTYGGTNNDFGVCAIQTTDSGYIIIGSTQSFGLGHERIYLIKTNADGDTLWTKTYDPVSYGGVGLSVKQTFDGGYILGCGDNWDNAGFLIRTDALGDTLWTKSCKIMSLASIEIQQTADSGYIIIGTGDDGTTFHYVYLVKTDVNGNPVWKNAFRGNSFNAQRFGYSVQQTPDGGYIAVGYIDTIPADVCLIKTDSFGDTLWTKSYGGDSVDVGLSIYLTADSGYIISGYTNSFGAGTADVYLIKTDFMGNIQWSKSFGSINYEEGRSVKQTTDGGYILAGNTNSFGAGSIDAYLIKTDANGYSGCYESSATTILKAAETIVSFPADTFFLDAIVVNSYSSIVEGGSLINTLCINTSINEFGEEETISIYPNPAQYNFTINIHAEVLNANVEIRNVLGEKIYSEKLDGKQKLINCESFTSGIYFVSVKTGSYLITKKLILNN